MNLEVIDWGMTPYADAVTRQLETVEQVLKLREAQPATAHSSITAGKIIFCSHTPVVTVGRGTKPGDVFGWSGEICETNRGGRATYHGPSQIVVYPVVDLQKSNDVHGYMRVLESAIVETLATYDVESEARTMPATEDSPSLTGVWVAGKKIASIGIAVRKGVAYHGLSLNFARDPLAFSGINPCGFKTEIMTSVEEVLDLPSSLDKAANAEAKEISIRLRSQMKLTLQVKLRTKLLALL